MSEHQASAGGAPAGWYAEPDVPGRLRWWDGTGWTDHYSAVPYTAGTEFRRVPEGTRTGTLWIWLLALGVSAIVLVQQIGITASFPSLMANPQNPYAVYTSPGYLLPMLLGVLLYGAQVVLAWRDRVELLRRGVDTPFPWPWVFLASAVYVIGRTVVLRRRGAQDAMAPLFGWIVGVVVDWAVTIVLVATIFAQLGSQLQRVGA